MSYVRIWIHVVFSTRNHEQYFDYETRRKLIEHIKINCRNKEILLGPDRWLKPTAIAESLNGLHIAVAFRQRLDGRKLAGL